MIKLYFYQKLIKKINSKNNKKIKLMAFHLKNIFKINKQDLIL